MKPSAYVAPEILRRERDAIFARTWQLVARTSQLEAVGAYVTAEIAGEPLLITRVSDGEIRAYYNVCPHRAGPLARGCGTRKTIQCGYHGWTFRLDGSLLRAPEMDGCDVSDVALTSVAVETWGPLVFAAIDPEVTLAEWLAGIPTPAALPHVLHRDYPVDANWKVYVDNYLEGYHIPIVHPELHRELDYERYQTVTDRWWSRQLSPLRETAAVYQADKGDQAAYYWVYPNLMLNIYQGQLQTNVVSPLSETRTIVAFDWFASAPDELVAFSDLLQAQDAEICATVQRNLGSRGAKVPRYSPRRENGVAHFHALWEAAMAV
jgi:choline monooxygenase